MKHLFITLLFLFSCSFLKSQNNNNWQNAILRADGLTQLEGVEAFCQRVNCEGQEHILVKFVNNNSQKVRIEWIDGVYMNGAWFYSANPNAKVLYLEPNSTLIGSCAESGKLKIAVSSIQNNPQDFQHYCVSGLTVIK